MRTWRAAVVMGLVLVSASAEVGALERSELETPPPAPPPAASSPPGVEVTVAESISDAETIRGWIEERTESALGSSERALAAGEIIHIAVRGRAFDYEIEVVLVRHGQALAGQHQPLPFACECGSQELLERVGEAVEAGVKALGEAAERERAEAAARAEAERRREEELEMEPDSRHRPDPRLTNLGKAGLALVAVGGAGALVGAVMIGVNRGEPLPNGYSYLERDWRNPTGFVCLGVGGAVLAGGAVMVALDVTRCPRNPDAPGCGQSIEPHGRRRARSLRGAPWAAAHGAGLSLWGRF